MGPAVAVHERRAAAVRRDGQPARTVPAAAPMAGVLRLQRAAGNRAVRALLRATLFEGLEADLRGRVQTATAPIDASKIELDAFGVDTSRLPENTTVAYGATVPTDATFRKGLASTAADMLDQKYTSPNAGAANTNFRENTTVKFAFDFSKQRGADGVWQFTYVKDGTSGAHKLLIDYLGAAPSFAAPSNETDRVGRLGWSISGFSDAEKQFVLQAIALVPGNAASLPPSGLKFSRQSKPTAGGACAPAEDWASGSYCHPAKTVTMYDRWISAAAGAAGAAGTGAAGTGAAGAGSGSGSGRRP
jgi:hypothetical protein